MAPSRSVRGARVDKSSRRGGGGSGPKTAPSKKKRHSDSSSSTPSDVLMTMESTLCRKCVWDLDTEPGLVCYSSDPRHECTRCAEEKKNCIDIPSRAVASARTAMRAAFAVRDADEATHQQHDHLRAAVARFRTAVQLRHCSTLTTSWMSPLQRVQSEMMEELLIAARLTADACRHMANLKPYRWAPVPSLPAFMRGNDDGSGGKGGNEQDEEEEEDPEEPEGPEDEVKIKIEPTSLFS